MRVLIDVSTIEDLEGQIARLMHHNQPNPYGADYVCVFCFKAAASNVALQIEHSDDCDGARLLRELHEAREPKDRL